MKNYVHQANPCVGTPPPSERANANIDCEKLIEQVRVIIFYLHRTDASEPCILSSMRRVIFPDDFKQISRYNNIQIFEASKFHIIPDI